MIGFIIKNECLDLLKKIKKQQEKNAEDYLFRPHQMFNDIINGNNVSERTLTKIIHEHDRDLTNTEIDNLYQSYIEDIHWSKRSDWIFFLIDENNKIFGEARFLRRFKFKIMNYESWTCDFCKKGDSTKIRNVIQVNGMSNMEDYNKWLEKIGRKDLQNCWKKSFHRCSNCQEKIHDYWVADKKLIEYFDNEKDINYWVYSIDYITFYENWKDFNFRKVNVLTYEKNK